MMHPDKLEEVQRILLRLIDPYLTAFGGMMLMMMMMMMMNPTFLLRDGP